MPDLTTTSAPPCGGTATTKSAFISSGPETLPRSMALIWNLVLYSKPQSLSYSSRNLLTRGWAWRCGATVVNTTLVLAQRPVAIR
jgi:hypothetical protein